MVVFGALAFLAGCQDNSPKIQIPPKWPGAAYHLSFGNVPDKPNPAGLTIPQIEYNANPDALENRADLVIQFDSSKAKSDAPVTNFMTMAAVDIKGNKGALPDDYVARASSELAKILAGYCINGKVKISVALTRSSLPMSPTFDQVEAKRMSDWTPIDLDFKNPQKKCGK